MADESIQRGVKRKRIHHSLHHTQQIPNAIEPAPQDPDYAEAQLSKSLTAALTMVGFDGVKSTALEMFRAQTEEFMLSFLSNVRTSMQSHRTTTPTAPDFSAALALLPATRTASLLAPHLTPDLLEPISYPSISPPTPPEPPAPDFSTLLKPLLLDRQPAHVPSHFPSLPPQHAWKSTPVFPTREKDARKMREKATEEGALAEQALRRLAAAQKAGAAKEAERKKSRSGGAALAGMGRPRDRGKKRAAPEAVLEDVFREFGEEDGMGLNGVDERGADRERVVVNSGSGGWRGAGRGMRL